MFPFARSSTGARPGRVLPGRGCSCSGWSGKWLGDFYKFKFIFTIWLSIFIYFKRTQTRVLLFYSRIVEIHVQTKPTTSLVNATALQSSRTVSAGGGGAGRCCGRGSAPAARPPPSWEPALLPLPLPHTPSPGAPRVDDLKKAPPSK